MILLKWAFPTPVGHYFAMVLFCLSLYLIMDNILTTVRHSIEIMGRSISLYPVEWGVDPRAIQFRGCLHLN